MNKKAWKRMFLISVVSMIVVAIFLSIWHLIAGSVPEIKGINILKWGWTLPFAISSWWNIIIAGVWSAIITSIVLGEERGKDFDWDDYIVANLIALIFTIVATTITIYPLTGNSLVCIVAFGIFSGLSCGFAHEILGINENVRGIYVITGFGTGLGFGLKIGLLVILLMTIVFVFAIFILIVVKYFVKIWCSLWRWSKIA